MTRRTLFTLIAFAAVAWIIIVAFASKTISGGEKTFLQVASVLGDHSYVVGQVGSPLSITKSAGPWKVFLSPDGRRNGFYSTTAKGPKGQLSVKAYWQELSGGSVEVYAIYRTKDWEQDQLVWGAPRSVTN